MRLNKKSEILNWDYQYEFMIQCIFKKNYTFPSSIDLEDIDTTCTPGAQLVTSQYHLPSKGTLKKGSSTICSLKKCMIPGLEETGKMSLAHLSLLAFWSEITDYQYCVKLTWEPTCPNGLKWDSLSNKNVNNCN